MRGRKNSWVSNFDRRRAPLYNSIVSVQNLSLLQPWVARVTDHVVTLVASGDHLVAGGSLLPVADEPRLIP